MPPLLTLAERVLDSCALSADNLFDGALDATAEIIFYLAPLIDPWDAPPHPFLRADRGDPPGGWRRKGPRATSRAWVRG